MQNAEHHAVIFVAGGTGTRMGSALPKQFLTLNNTPILIHTLRNFHAFNPFFEMVVVMHHDYISFWKDLCLQFENVPAHTVVAGGEERFHSVKNGLNALSENVNFNAYKLNPSAAPILTNVTPVNMSVCFNDREHPRA